MIADITITLTFMSMKESTLSSNHSSDNSSTLNSRGSLPIYSTYIFSHNLEQGIDTQAPLYLDSGMPPCCPGTYASFFNLLSGEGCFLVLDLLAVHLIRSTSGNTIISFHDRDQQCTSAPYLHERIRFAGQSVYWQSIFQKSSDPTFILLTYIWHAMYAWDQALERLYTHICSLETRVLTTRELQLTRELHDIRAHHLHYSSLLEDFRKSVLFILDTPNPAMDSLPDKEKQFSRKLLEKECKNLILEIDRLELSRRMQDKRLKNVMNLVCTLMLSLLSNPTPRYSVV